MTPATQTPPDPRPPAWRGARLLAMAWKLLALVFFGALAFAPYVEGDTWHLLDDADGLTQCLRDGRAGACGQGGKFAPLQLVVAVGLRALGLSHRGVGWVLAWAALASFIALLRLIVRTPKDRAAGVGAALILCSGLPLHYATHSYVELPAAALVAWFVASWLNGRLTQLFVSALLASLTKDTTAPFLGVLALILLFAPLSERARGSKLKLLLLAAGGAGLGLAGCAGLNLYRFSSPLNVAYLNEATGYPPVGAWLKTWLALWVAPNGGLLFFFPLFVFVLGLATALSLRPGAGRSPWQVPVGAIALLLGLTASLARWWAPFGWWAWGQRLTLPFLPGVLLLLASVESERLGRLARAAVATPARCVVSFALMALLSVPHVVSLARGSAIIHDTFVYQGNCDELPHGDGNPRFQHCMDEREWSDPSPLGRAWAAVFHRRAWPLVVCALLLWASIGHVAWRSRSEAVR